MDQNKLLFLQEDHRDTFNKFYPYHEEMQRLFGVPVYEERKKVGKYLNTVSNLFGNSTYENSELDSGINSTNLTYSILNFTTGFPNSSSNTYKSCSDDSSNSILDCFLKSFHAPRMSPDEPTKITFQDPWLKSNPTPNAKEITGTSFYSLFGDNTLDLTSQIIKTSVETKPQSGSSTHQHIHVFEANKISETPSFEMQSEANDIGQGVYPDVFMSFYRNPRLRASTMIQELRRRKFENIPILTSVFPSAARLKKAKQKACKFCKKNGELPEFYNGHAIKDINDMVTCPILRRYICDLCGATGDKAHTRKYCPNYVGFEERLPLFRRLANGVISPSHNHK